MITRWEEWYAPDNLGKDGRILAAPPSQCVKKAAREFLDRRKQRILDVACGVGRDTFFLERQGLSVIGVDASINGVKAACQRRSGGGAIAEFVSADARSLPFGKDSFEGVYCFGLLHEFVGARKDDSVRRVVAEIGRVLHRNGILIITALAGNPEDGLPHLQLFTRQMFEQALAGFKPLEIRCYDDVGCTNQTQYHIWYGLFAK